MGQYSHLCLHWPKRYKCVQSMAEAKYSYNLADTLQAPILAKALNKYINGQHAFSKSLRLKRYMHGAMGQNVGCISQHVYHRPTRCKRITWPMHYMSLPLARTL
jgi:hypothetical protein